MKTDPEQEISNLLAASQRKPETQGSQVNHKQKQLVYKIAGQLKDSKNTCSVDQVWKRFMCMSERETCMPGTYEPILNNKEHLRTVLEVLEEENLLMFASEDDKVVLV